MKNQILEKIEEFKDIYLVPHKRPDGDCLGSSFGFKYVIENLYPEKNVYVIGHHVRGTEFMGEFSELDESILSKALVISLDTGSRDRIYDERVLNAEYVIRIDHHPKSDSFGNIEFIEPTFPSTCTLLTEIFRIKEIEIPLKAAECLFFGTVTDTGGFKHRGVNSNTHINVAHLLKTGIKTADIFNQVYLRELNSLEFDRYVLNNLNFTDEGIIYIKFTKEVLDDLNIDNEHLEDALEIIQNIKGYPVWIVFYELNNKIRAKLRSRGPLVDEIARKYKGGGHPLASGATLDSWENIDKILNELNNKIIKHKKG